MSSKSLIIPLIIIAVVLGAYFIIRGAGNLNSTSVQPTATSRVVSIPPSATSSSQTQQFQVIIKNSSFNPSTLAMKKGTTITWINQDSIPHTITSDDKNGILNSQQLDNGQSYSKTFNDIGQFNYHCSIHPKMKASVTIID